MAPESPRSWMQTHRVAFGNQRIDMMCIPYSHDAGTSYLSFGTAFGTEDNVLTQKKSIFDQLELGVRYFDIRPTLAKGTWHCGHYTNTGKPGIGWQGGSCVPMKDVVNDLNRFTQDNAELIVIDVSHVWRINYDETPTSKSYPSPEQWNELFGILSNINHRFTRERNGGTTGQLLSTLTLDKFIGSGEAAVVVTVDDYEDYNGLLNQGFWPHWIKKDVQKYLELGVTWLTAGQTDGEAIWSTVTGWTGLNPYSVLNLVNEKHRTLFPQVLQYLANNYFTAMIATDCVENSDQLTLCLAASYQRFNREHNLHNKVIVFGGALIVDQGVHERLQRAIDNGDDFEVTCDNLSCDPWPGMVKSCAVFYEKDGKQQGRWAPEYKSLRISKDIEGKI